MLFLDHSLCLDPILHSPDFEFLHCFTQNITSFAYSVLYNKLFLDILFIWIRKCKFGKVGSHTTVRMITSMLVVCFKVMF